jgi:hypothetical protein
MEAGDLPEWDRELEGKTNPSFSYLRDRNANRPQKAPKAPNRRFITAWILILYLSVMLALPALVVLLIGAAWWVLTGSPMLK